MAIHSGQVDGARRALEDDIDDLLCNAPAPAKGSQLRNMETGKCLHVDGDGNSPWDYTSVIITDCDDNSNNQRWIFSGSNQLLHAPSGMCLDMDANNNNKVRAIS